MQIKQIAGLAVCRAVTGFCHQAALHHLNLSLSAKIACKADESKFLNELIIIFISRSILS